MKQSFGKLFIICITLIMLCNTAVASTIYGDIAGSDIEEPANLLNVLGIMNGEIDGSFSPDENITRKEFAVIVCKMLGLGDAASQPGETSFSDVPSDDAASGSIKLASEMGMINGYSDGKFYPDEIVTYEQVVKVLVCALGYELYAQRQGGYPAGYFTVAAEKGLTKQINGTLGSEVNRGMMARLVYNALDIDIMDQTEFGDENQFSIAKDKTILSEKLNIEKGEGRVVATGDTALVGSSPLGNTEVMIDRRIYKIGDTNIEDFLGYSVTYYARKDREGGNETLVYVSIEPNDNQIVTIEAKNIDSSTTKEKFVYWLDKDKDNKPKEVTVSRTVDVVFNGKAFASYTDGEFKPDSGKVVLIDSDRDNVYDTAIITSYKTYVIDSVNMEDKIIYDKYNQPKLDLGSSDVEVNIIKNGQKTVIDNLQEWNVLSVAESKGDGTKELITLVVSDNSVKGKVTETEDDDASTDAVKAVYIDGNKYEVAANYTDAINMDTSGTFYLNVEGEIAGLDEETSGEYQYAYLIDAASLEGVADICEIKLFNTKGKIAVYTGAKKIKIDGIPFERKDDIIQELKTPREGGAIQNDIIPQVVKYGTNSAGEIDYIDTVKQGPDENEDNLRVSTASGSYKYKSREKSFGLKFVTGKKTVILNVPTDKTDEDSYRIKKVDEFVNDSSYTLMAYNASSGNVPDLIFQEGGGSALNNSTPLTLVEKVTTSVNKDGEKVYRLYCVYKNEVVGINAKAGLVLNVALGDVIRYSKNAKEEIDNYVKVFSYDNSDPNAEIRPLNGVYEKLGSGTDVYGEYRVVYGQVYAKDSGEGTFVVKSPTNSILTCTTNIKAPIYIYNSTKKTAAVGTKEDLIDYEKQKDSASTVLIRMRYGETADIIIFK